MPHQQHQDFVEQVKNVTLLPGECLSSYGVRTLFTPVPVDPALGIIKDLLEKDPTLKERTVMSVGDIVLLLEFCLKNTYFSFQGQFNEQVEGMAMGSPVSPIVANLHMECFEQKVPSTAPTPRLWHQYVDDTFAIQKEENKQNFPQHINSDSPTIQLTLENMKEDGAIPFLDTIVKPETDGKLSITVYRNPTHTDQYLQLDSYHHLSAIYSVINTLTHRAKTVAILNFSKKKWSISRKHLPIAENPKWALDKM